MVRHIPNTLEIVVISCADELIEDLEGDPEKDLEFKEHEINLEVEEVESSAFDPSEEPEDESSSDYDPSRDH